MKRLSLTILLNLSVIAAYAQQVQFAAHEFADLIINSAKLAADRDASLTLIHRNQKLGGTSRLFSSYVSGKYPVVNRANNVLSLGIGYGENRYKAPGSYMDQTIAGSLAYGLNLNRFTMLSFAMDLSLVINKIDLAGATTGLMWVETGFDPNLPSGENLVNDKLSYAKLNTSIYLRTFDQYNNDRLYLGLSIHQLNKKKSSFYDPEAQELAPSLNLIGGFRVAERDKLLVSTNLLFNRFDGMSYFKLGLDFNYGLYRYNKRNAVKENSINIGTYFDFSKGAQIYLQYRQPKYVIGAAYHFDTNRGIENRAFNNAVEVMFVVRNPLEPNNKRRTINGLKRIKPKKKKDEPKVRVPVELEEQEIHEKDSLPPVVSVSEEIIEEEVIQDSTRVDENVTEEDQQEWRTSIGLGSLNQFTFESNSTDISKESKQVLFHLVRILNEFEGSHIILVGHTDNVGNSEDNLSLSMRRASVVRENLIDLGVDSEKIRVQGMGEIQPLSSNETEVGRRTNRRVEFIILKGSNN